MQLTSTDGASGGDVNRRAGGVVKRILSSRVSSRTVARGGVGAMKSWALGTSKAGEMGEKLNLLSGKC